MTRSALTSPAVTAGAGRGADLLGDLRDEMTPRRLRAGQVLFEQDAVATALFVVDAGTLRVSRRTGSGRHRIVALMRPGDVVGEMSLLDDSRRDATVSAVTEAVVLEMGHAQFDELLLTRPSLNRVLIELMGRRLRESNEAVADLVFADVPSRVARLLRRLLDQLGQEGPDGTVSVEHGLTQDELAQCVGAARESVNKALASFARRGWLEVRPRSILVLDPEQLRALTS